MDTFRGTVWGAVANRSAGSECDPVAGMAAVTDLVDRLGLIRLLDAAIGPIKTCERGCSGGELLVGIAVAQLTGENFLVGLDRQRDDAGGQLLASSR